MIELVPLKPWHIEVLRSEGYVEDSVYVEGYAKYLSDGEAVAVICNGKIVGAGGVIPLWNGVADGWTIVTDYLRAHPLLLVKSFKKFFNEVCPSYKRVQITVVEGFEKAETFAEYLGFTPEGRMVYYSPTGETHMRYARIS